MFSQCKVEFVFRIGFCTGFVERGFGGGQGKCNLIPVRCLSYGPGDDEGSVPEA